MRIARFRVVGPWIVFPTMAVLILSSAVAAEPDDPAAKRDDTPPSAPASDGGGPATPPAGARDAAIDAALEGAWVVTEPPPDAPAGAGAPFVMLAFDQAADDAWSIRLWVPAALVIGEPLRAPRVESDGRFSGAWTGRGMSVEITGRIEIATRSLSVQMDATRGGERDRVALVMHPTQVAAEMTNAVRYTAELDVGAAKLPMAIRLADAGELGWVGAIDIPVQGVTAMPMRVRRTEGGFDVLLPVGLPARMTLEEKDGGTRLEGTFAQGPVTAPIVFVRTDEPMKGSLRPQEPKPPFPYEVREVRVPTTMGHELAGSLTLPPGASSDHRVPAVVMLTGSGLQDRDESLMGHRPFLVIADALTRAGIAVLRCDDRGFGGSGGNGATATTVDFAEDGRAMMAFLRAQPEVDSSKCGYIGHSEGGLSGPLAALRDQEAGQPVAFVVMLAGPAVPGIEVLPLQMRRLMSASGATDEEIGPVIELQRRALGGAVGGMTDEELAPMLAELMSRQKSMAATRDGGAAPPSVAADSAEVRGAIEVLRSPWIQMFLTLDPAPTLRAVRAPVLAVNGDLDTQVDSEQNLLRIEAIRNEAGLPVAIRRYSKLNHLFQPATTGAIEEYSTTETTIDPVVLADLEAWILETTATTKAPTVDPGSSAPKSGSPTAPASTR